MFRETFLVVIALWTTVHADYPNDAFETICVPGKSCYYVSKFKTSWETAQEMCQEKIQTLPSVYNETDNMILNSMSDTLLTKRYWVVEPRKEPVNKHHHKITIVLNRKRRSMNEQTETVVTSVEEVKNWNWETLVENSKGINRGELRNNIKEMFKTIRSKGGKITDKNLLNKWQKTYKVLRKARTHRNFKRVHERWTELTDEFGKEHLQRIIEQIGSSNNKLGDNQLKEILVLIRNKQFDKLKPEWLGKLKKIIYIVKEKIHGKDSYKQKLLIQWKRHLKLLIRLNWKELIKHVSAKYKDRVIKTINELTLIVQNKDYKMINLKLVENVNFVMRLMHRIWTIHIKYGGREKAELIRTIKVIISANWQKLIDGISGIDKVKWIERFTKVIRLIKLRQYNEIDIKWLLKFREIIDKVKTKISIRPSKGKFQIKRIKHIFNLLIKWNWKELIKHINVNEREKIIKEIQLIIDIVKNRQFNKIDINFMNRIKTIMLMLRKIKKRNFPKISQKETIRRLIKKYKFIIDVDWKKIIDETKGIDKVKWTRRILKLIELIKRKEFDKIDIKWLQKFRKVIKVIRKETKKIPLTKEKSIDKIKKYVVRFNKINWRELIKTVDVKERDRLTKEIELVIKLIKENRFNEIDFNLVTRIRPIIRLLEKVRRKKEPKVHPKIEIKRLIKKYKFIIDVDWKKIIDQNKNIDKVKWTKRMIKLIELIKRKEFDKIDIKWLQKFKKVIKVIRKETDKIPLTKEKSIDKVTKYVTRFNKINWKELIKTVDEKDREKITKEIELVIKLIKEKRFNEIDFKLVTRIRPIIRKLEKIKENKITETETTHKPITDEEITEKPTIDKEITGKPIVEKEVTEKPAVEKETTGKLIDEEKVTETPTINKETTGKPIVEKEVTEKPTINKETTGKPIVEKEVTEKPAVEKETTGKLIDEKEVTEKPALEKETTGKPSIEKEITEKSVVDKETTDKPISEKEITEKPTIEKEKIEVVKETSIKYNLILKELKWEKLIKYVEEKNRPEVNNKIRTFITFIQNNEFEKIDSELLTWITEIISTLKKAKEIQIKEQVTNKDNQKNIIETSNKYINRLLELKWEELVKYIEESSRPNIVNKITTFITFVKNNEFEKIDLELLSWIIEILKTLEKVKEMHIKNQTTEKENQKIITETSTNYIKELMELKWEELMKYIQEQNRPDVIRRVTTFITFVQNKQFEKIDSELLNSITTIITTLRKVQKMHITNKETEKENLKIITETSTKYIKILIELKWEELVKYIDESSREEVMKRLKTFITLVQNKEFEKINIELLNSITSIITTFRQIVVSQLKSGNKGNVNIIKKFQLTLPSNWLELIKRIGGIDQNLWISRIQNLLVTMKTGEYQKINFDWIEELERIVQLLSKESLKIKKEAFLNEASIQILRKNVKLLKEWNWESYLQYVDENNRQQIQKDINEMITIVESEKFESLEIEFVKWFYQIFETFTKINQAIANGYVYDTKINTWVKDLGVVKNLIRKKRCFLLDKIFRKTGGRRQQKPFTGIKNHFEKKKKFVNKLFRFLKGGKKQIHEVKKGYRKIYIHECKKNVNLLKKWNWKKLVRYVVGENKEEVVSKIKYIISLINNNEYENIDEKLVNWLNKIVTGLRRVKETYVENENIDSNKKVIIKNSLKYVDILNNLRWKEVIRYIDETNQPEIKEKINTFINYVINEQYEKIDNEMLNNLNEIITTLKQTRETKVKPVNTKTKEIIKNIEINLPSNWIDLIKKIDGVDENVWIPRIQNLLTLVKSKQYENIDFEWIEEFRKIVDVMNTESKPTTSEKTVIDETTKTSLKSKVESLKEWKWETYLIYIDETTRPQVETDTTKMITACESDNFDSIDINFVNWFNQIYEIFTKINNYLATGYVYEAETKTWVKTIDENKSAYRRKRSIDSNNMNDLSANVNIELINRSIRTLQKALLYNMMIQKNKRQQINSLYAGTNEQSEKCPFIGKVNDKLITKLTNCAIKQRFICKKDLN